VRVSDPLWRGNRSFVDDVAGVEGRSGLEEEHVGFGLRDGPMLDASRNDEELSFPERDIPIAKLHDEAATNDEEELVFVFVLMPHELPLELHELDLLAVEFPDDLGIPLRVEQRELLAEIDLLNLRHRVLTPGPV
jgi:hypothetical protein